MRPFRAVMVYPACLFLVLVIAGHPYWAGAHQSGSANSTPVSPTKDSQALAILTHCIQATGGPMAVAGLQDFIGTGTMTHFWAGQLVQDTATVRGLGMSDFRLDDDRSDGTHSWSVSEAGGQHRTPDGTTSPMPWGDAVNLLSVTWPLPILVEAVNNPIWQVSLIGQANFNGRAAFDIRVEQIFSTAADPGGKFSALTTRDVFIDSGNYVVLGIQDLTHRNDVFHRTYVRQILYSDYRPVSGLSVPFSVTETISGQKVWTFTLSSISFNNNLTAADFAL